MLFMIFTNQKQIIAVLKSLANPRRLQIITYLKKKESSNVYAIARKIELSHRSTSKHLLNLENAGLVSRKQRSRDVFYQLNSGISPVIISIIDSFARMSE